MTSRSKWRPLNSLSVYPGCQCHSKPAMLQVEQICAGRGTARFTPIAVVLIRKRKPWARAAKAGDHAVDPFSPPFTPIPTRTKWV
jgi:hypothetical protein